MKKRLQAWVAAGHYLLGRKATALPDGIQISSFAKKSKILAYSEIQRCIIRPVQESIKVISERSDVCFHRVVLIGDTCYAMKMTKHESESFMRHLRGYAPNISISTAPERIWSIQILPK